MSMTVIKNLKYDDICLSIFAWDVMDRFVMWKTVAVKFISALYNMFLNQFYVIKMLRGAEEACWAHNPKVLGSKPSGAIFWIPTSEI